MHILLPNISRIVKQIHLIINMLLSYLSASFRIYLFSLIQPHFKISEQPISKTRFLKPLHHVSSHAPTCQIEDSCRHTETSACPLTPSFVHSLGETSPCPLTLWFAQSFAGCTTDVLKLSSSNPILCLCSIYIALDARQANLFWTAVGYVWPPQ